MSGFSYAIYTIANFYPKNYIMVPAAICVGIGDGILWSSMPIFFSFFAAEYQKITNSEEMELTKFSGYFFAIFQLSKIIGNSINFVVLQAFCTGEGCHHSGDAIIRNITYCGANDCQDPEQIQGTINNYVPSEISKYIILGTMLAMYVAAILLFAVLMPRMKSSRTASIKAKEGGRSAGQKVRGELKFVKTTLTDTVRQIFKLKQILLMPGIFYGGFDFGFLTSELTRAYTSCVFGVSQVTIHLMIFGVSACVFSTLSGKLSKCIPSIAFILFAALVDAATYTYYLFWTPNASTQWSVIPAYILAGGMQGIWKPQSLAIQARTFSSTLDVASAVWLLWWTLGICMQFAISPLACVSEKITVQLAILGISTAGFVTVDIMERISVVDDGSLSSDMEETSLNTNMQESSSPHSNLVATSD